MPKRDKPRDDKAVKLDRILARKAKMIAEDKGISIGEYLTEITRTTIERDWIKTRKSLDQLADADE